jgi:hypothetical protein
MSRHFMTSPMAVAAVALIGSSALSHAGPCTAQIVQLEQRIRQVQAVAPPGDAGTPSGPQSVGAQLHHQPTPGSVQSAESKAREAAAAAFDRARKADAGGDAAKCAAALKDARELYGLQ